jgi:hypothetical protein
VPHPRPRSLTVADASKTAHWQVRRGDCKAPGGEREAHGGVQARHRAVQGYAGRAAGVGWGLPLFPPVWLLRSVAVTHCGCDTFVEGGVAFSPSSSGTRANRPSVGGPGGCSRPGAGLVSMQQARFGADAAFPHTPPCDVFINLTAPSPSSATLRRPTPRASASCGRCSGTRRWRSRGAYWMQAESSMSSSWAGAGGRPRIRCVAGSA